MELSNLTDDELIRLWNNCDSKIAAKNSMQIGLKILLNAGYGALGSPYFLYYMVENAEAITLGGQFVNRYTTNALDGQLRKIFNLDETFIVAGDTDSVVGDTVLSLEYDDTSIENFFNSCEGVMIKNDEFNKDYVKKLTKQVKAWSVSSSGELGLRDVVYVMKHKVRKKMYRLTVGEHSVEVTEDHSVVVKRNGELIPIKPKHMKKGDKVVLIS